MQILKTYTKKVRGYIVEHILHEDGTSELMYQHRRVWVEVNGDIPKGYEIHHRDSNKLNNSISNLVCIPKHLHTFLHLGRL